MLRSYVCFSIGMNNTESGDKMEASSIPNHAVAEAPLYLIEVLAPMNDIEPIVGMEDIETHFD